MAKRKWEYTHLLPGEDRLDDWLNQMDANGWEFVGTGRRSDDDVLWWIFRRPYHAIDRGE